MVAIAEITPTARINVIDLLERAGLDVSDWGGATNRAKSSEWTFGEANDAKVLTIWTSELQEIDGAIIRQIEPKRYLSEFTPRQVRRAQRFIDAVRIAFNQQQPVQVILCVLNPQRTGAQFRDLDPETWCVTTHDEVRDVYTLVRGALPVAGEIDLEAQGFLEGPRRQQFVIHRRREAEARRLKLEQHRRSNNGRLVCEVPNCGFDFASRYGEIGVGYAQVHHCKPLNQAPAEGWITELKDLAVICANCHAMVHRGGECRPLDSLIPATR